MRTHEAADADDSRNQVDFCWEDSYVQMVNQYSITYPNGSPRQAFRAGFREGVKMGLHQGAKINPDDFKKVVWFGNMKRLITWCSVGADVENGLWSIYGTRLGCQMTNLTDWDFLNVRDFEWLNTFFAEEIMPKFATKSGPEYAEKCYKTGYVYDTRKLWHDIVELGTELRKGLGIEVAELDNIQSKFYKAAYYNVPRMNKMFTESELEQLRKTNR